MKRNMLTKDLWSHTPNDVFSTSYDGQTGKDMSSLTFDDSNSYVYRPNRIPSTDDLNFFKGSEDKESSDLLYNDWPDVGNFEEVGRVLRSCNSSFGLGATGNHDEMDWFTPEESNVECEEVLATDFKFPCSEPNSLINISHDHGTPESDDKRSGYEFENKDQGVKSKGVLQLTNGKAIHFKKDNRMYQHQKRNVELDSSGYNTYLHPSYGHTTNQTTSCSVLNGMKSERNGLTSPSQKESSYVSNQIHSSETSGDPSLQEETIVKVDDRRNVHQLHQYETSFTGNPRQMGMFLQSSKCDLISSQKQVYMYAKELKNQSEKLDGFWHGDSAEIGLLNVAESSSVSSGSDDISLEATILLQLQQVMEHLDLKTKLCIKDSLYRLATSAEQRHNRAGLSSSTADYSDIGWPLLTARTNKCTGFLDIESNTNPIDRSLAHLLFYTPSDSSTLPASSPLKPSPKMHGFITSPPAVDFKLDCREEAANRTDCKIVDV